MFPSFYLGICEKRRPAKKKLRGKFNQILETTAHFSNIMLSLSRAVVLHLSIFNCLILHLKPITTNKNIKKITFQVQKALILNTLSSVNGFAGFCLQTSFNQRLTKIIPRLIDILVHVLFN